jgi:hypothetical protein
LTRQDARGLRNGTRLPFIISMTCLNGFFHDVYSECVAEALVEAERGGAVAVWASSALTPSSAQMPLNQAAVRLLSQEKGLTLGEAIVRAKASVADGEVRRSWVLLGDPATRIK